MCGDTAARPHMTLFASVNLKKKRRRWLSTGGARGVPGGSNVSGNAWLLGMSNMFCAMLFFVCCFEPILPVLLLSAREKRQPIVLRQGELTFPDSTIAQDMHLYAMVFLFLPQLSWSGVDTLLAALHNCLIWQRPCELLPAGTSSGSSICLLQLTHLQHRYYFVFFILCFLRGRGDSLIGRRLTYHNSHPAQRKDCLLFEECCARQLS